ncbi:putative NAD(P)H nitroreductase MhqN [Paenibacillus antibioticophila]|uniref:NAD(P)H nitroreductase MhqN n=1 Tax=Paenibacillus antibioticophila TaxID=1274374 RepID=A0A920CH31_9BACL|nr:nitroreductase family protein [Paenibacillus antibioticophila]GIO37378.1 putative NAD(P)H nitroreductase MhqN [Paenibacillus antibioticophila]
MSDFQSIIKDRRSANRFVEGIEIPQSDLEEIFTLSKFAPSSYNLQHTHYLVVTDRAKIEEIYERTHQQYKIKTASAIIYVLGDVKAHLKAADLNEGLKNLGVLSEQEYNAVVEQTIQFYESKGDTFQREDAIRNASIAAMQLMLIAKDLGWDTCPMHSTEDAVFKEMFDVSDNLIPVMMIALGKSAPESFRPRGYRKPVNEFVKYYN